MNEKVLELEQRFVQLKSEYAGRKKIADQTTVDWQYASWRLHDPKPLGLDRDGIGPGKTLRQQPTALSDYFSYGLDGEMRIVQERQHNRFGYYESFFSWSDTAVEVARYDYGPEKKPRFLMQMMRFDGQPVAAYHVATMGALVEQYEWMDGRLAGVQKFHSERKEGRLGNMVFYISQEIIYDAEGRIDRIVNHWPAKPPRRDTPVTELVFERRGKRIWRKM